METLRWGIAGTGKICHDFVVALQLGATMSHLINAVAARSEASAASFAQEHKIPEYFQGYDSLGLNKNIDIVYIGVLNPAHYDLAKFYLEKGKHVLCEKPMCINTRQTEELIKCAKANKRFLMEAIWSRSFPAYKALKDLVKNEEVGEIQEIHANLGFTMPDVERVRSRTLGGGVILDLGVYVLQLVQFVFAGLEPEEITCKGHLNELGVDESAVIIIRFPGKKTAVLSIHCRVNMSNTAELMGARGVIKVPDFWCPKSIVLPTDLKSFPFPNATANFNFHNSIGLAYEADEAHRCIGLGLTESPDVPWKDSLELVRWRDAIRAQLGVTFEADTA